MNRLKPQKNNVQNNVNKKQTITELSNMLIKLPNTIISSKSNTSYQQ